MPRVPTYDAQRGLQAGKVTTEASAVRISNESFTEGIKAMGRFGETLADIGEKQYYLQAKNELSKANLQSMERMNQSMLNASQDPQSEGFLDRRNKEIQSAKEDIVKTIKNPLAKKQFQVEFDNDAIQLGYKYKVMHNHLIIDETLTNFDAERAGISQQYFDAGSIQEKEKLVGRVAERYEDLWKMGAMTKREAGREFTAWRQNLVVGQVEYDIERDNAITTDESYVYNQLLLGEKGIYKDLVREDKTEALENIQKKIARNQKITIYQANRNQDSNEAKMVVDWSEGNLKLEDIKGALLTGKVRRSFGERMLKKFYEDPNPNTDISTYNQIREMQVGGISAKEINQFIIDNSDKLSIEDRKSLINKTFSEADSKQKERIRYNASSLKIWASKNLWDSTGDKDLTSDIVYDFHKRVNEENATGIRVDEIAQEVIKNKIKVEYPDTALLEDVPNFVAERNKVKRMYERESKIKAKTKGYSKPNVIINSSSISSGLDWDNL